MPRSAICIFAVALSAIAAQAQCKNPLIAEAPPSSEGC